MPHTQATRSTSRGIRMVAGSALPGGRPVFSTLTRCRHGAVGLWKQGRMTGYTNSGLGVAYPPVRFNCRGEIALITLRCGR